MSDNKTIEVIDKIAEQFGVAIDWTQKDVVPYLQDLISRCQACSIIQDSLWVIFLLIGVIVFVGLFIWIAKQYKNENVKSIWIDHNEDFSIGSILMFILGILFIASSLVILPFVINDLFNWIFVPEYQFYRMLIK